MSDKQVDKFMGGALTPNEAHRKFAFGGHHCDVCGGPPALCVRVFAKVDDVLQKSPEWVIKESAKHGGKLPVVDFKDGKYVRISMSYACDRCKATLEREAAKAPSWCCVEIERGVESTNPVSTQSAGILKGVS
jgi:hypothetical protein